jgi:hypothetical protein
MLLVIKETYRFTIQKEYHKISDLPGVFLEADGQKALHTCVPTLTCMALFFL